MNYKPMKIDLRLNKKSLEELREIQGKISRVKDSLEKSKKAFDVATKSMKDLKLAMSKLSIEIEANRHE